MSFTETLYSGNYDTFNNLSKTNTPNAKTNKLHYQLGDLEADK